MVWTDIDSAIALWRYRGELDVSLHTMGQGTLVNRLPPDSIDLSESGGFRRCMQAAYALKPRPPLRCIY